MLTPQEIQAFRKMTPADRLNLAGTMHLQAREWKRAAFKAQHPNWSPEQIKRRVREVFLYGTG